jgi:ABC-type Fe3+ transport system substrate-binding protein
LRVIPLAGLLLFGALAAGCGADDNTGASAPVNHKSDCGADDPKAWDALVDAARKEGTVAVTSNPNGDVNTAIPAAFKKAFGITVEYSTGRNSEVAAKVEAERKAGKYSLDIMIGGAGTLGGTAYPADWLADVKDSLIGEKILDASNWREGAIPFRDPDGKYALALTTHITPMLAINTDMVKDGEVNGWQDLVNPKWKGKIVADDPRVAGGASYMVSNLRDTFGDDFVKKLYVGNKVTVSGDTDQAVTGLSKGEYAIGISMKPIDVNDLIDQGLPLKVITAGDAKQVKTDSGGILAMFNHAPHPNAAKLFANWMACKDGNEVWNESIGDTSSRTDVNADAPGYRTIEPDGDYFDASSWDYIQNEDPETQKFMKSILGS